MIRVGPATLSAWADMLHIAVVDEEASHFFLVPFVAAWLVWVKSGRTYSMGDVTARLEISIIFWMILQVSQILWKRYNLIYPNCFTTMKTVSIFRGSWGNMIAH
mgnify:CR=1 FL=1